jgi:predicted dienelactone hydrolase
MRALEILLVVADLVAFLLLVVSLRGRARWLHHAALIPLPAMGVQLLVEGPRWQLLPAYALAGLLLLVWLWRTSKLAGRPARRRWTRRLAVGVGAGLGVLGLAIAAALPLAFPVVRLPHPTGPYAIGTLTYHWVDAARPEVFTADPNDRCELMVQIWYPAKADPSAPRAPYIQDADVVAPALARFMKLPEFALGQLKYVTSNAVPSAPVADDQRSYPVLLFLEGLGGYRQMNTFQVEELVSHGYIVAAIDQPYAAATVVFPYGRQAAYDPRMDPPHRQAAYDPRTAPAHSAFADAHIPYLAQDVVFTLDQLVALNRADPNGILTGRLDLRRAGLFGHSLGGIVGAEAGRLEPRLRALLLEDAYMPADVVRDGLRQPTMWITRDADTMRLERRRSGGWSEAAIHEHLTTMRAVFERLPGDGYYVQVPGTFHVDMNDAPLLSPLASRLGLSGPIGAQRAHRIINAYSLAFFDRHLKGRPAALLDGPAKQYPEVLFETRRPSRSPSPPA